MPASILAAAVLALEAVGLCALAAWQAVALLSGDTVSVATALALLILTLVGVAALAGFAVATARGRSWGRSGGIVAQVLVLAVALGALTGVGADPMTAAAIAAPGVIGLVLLLLAVKQSGPDRKTDGS